MTTEKICWITFERIVRRMNDAQILFAIDDAKQALVCAREFERLGLPNGVDKYTKQIETFNQELDRRCRTVRR